MFGMNEAQFNAAKRQAKKCGEAMKADVEKRGKYVDEVMKGIIAEHYQSVAPMLTITQFIWLCGYLRGRWGNAFDRE